MGAKKSTGKNNKPNLHKRLFWDWKYEAIDWQVIYPSVIARVVERGTDEEIEELIRFYGKPKVINALMKEILYLPDYAVDKVTHYFSIQKEELACYERKRLRKGHWI
ncbi:DUF6922 domain-containing protein [Pseudoflavitalea rhizosphaerae]|uniref:DUF6922 domain-containing protein n=1 Tax=Pseudoflavitalea rhizosphaerae TaxID=1884793 RepID=UPI000F8D5B5A|nr:hypothetical protein [Pseudoflavitalea rhizosphaerae]